MLGSNVAGLMTLFWTNSKFDANMQAGMIIVAAFGGTWFLEQMLNKVTDKLIESKKEV
jgi:hypothetical protein